VKSSVMKAWVIKLLIVGVLLTYCFVGLAASDKPYAGTTITWIYQEHTTTPLYKELLPQFEEETGIKVNVLVYPYGELEEKEKMSFALGSDEYDVGFVSAPLVPDWVERGWCTPLNEFIEDPEMTNLDWLALDDWALDVLELYSWKGESYALPGYLETSVLFYRKDLFEECGITNPPQTFVGLEAACRKLKDKGYDAIAFRARREWYNSESVFPYFLHAMGGDSFNYATKEVTINDPVGLEAAEFVAHLLNEYGPPGPASIDWEDVRDLMFAGKVAMIIDCSGWAARFEGPDSDVAGKLGYAPPPQGVGGMRPVWGSNAFFIPSFSKHKEAAWQFIQWAIQPANRIYMAKHGSSYIDRLSTLADPGVQEAQNFPGFLDALQVTLAEIKPCHFPCTIPFLPVAERIGIAINQVIARQYPAKEALDNCAEDLRAILEEAGYR